MELKQIHADIRDLAGLLADLLRQTPATDGLHVWKTHVTQAVKIMERHHVACVMGDRSLDEAARGEG